MPVHIPQITANQTPVKLQPPFLKLAAAPKVDLSRELSYPGPILRFGAGELWFRKPRPFAVDRYQKHSQRFSFKFTTDCMKHQGLLPPCSGS